MKIQSYFIGGMAAILAFTACSSNSESPKKEIPLKVEVYSPVHQDGDGIFLSGTVSAKQTAMVSTRYMGFVQKIYVKQGDRVKAGQLLVSINSDDLRAKQAQAQAMVTEATAAVKNANRDLERYEALRKLNSVSDKELENMSLNSTSYQARLQVAQQTLREVNSMLAYTQIRAPFSGVVVQKLIDEGSTANPGMPLLAIEQAGELNVTASVPENYVQYIKVGDRMKIDIKSIGKQYWGSVTELSPSASLTGGQYSIKVKIDSPDKQTLRPGMYASLYLNGAIPTNGTQTILIEESSVVYRDQLTGVYVVNADQKAMLRWIRLGKKVGSQVEVLSGLNPSDQIIRVGHEKMYNGRKVTISNKK